MASDEDWYVRSHSFSTDNEISSVFSADGDFCHDYLAPLSPTSPRAEDNLDPNKSSLDKELDELTSLKKRPPHAVSVQDFKTLYDLPKTGKNPYKLKFHWTYRKQTL